MENLDNEKNDLYQFSLDGCVNEPLSDEVCEYIEESLGNCVNEPLSDEVSKSADEKVFESELRFGQNCWFLIQRGYNINGLEKCFVRSYVNPINDGSFEFDGELVKSYFESISGEDSKFTKLYSYGNFKLVDEVN